MHVNVWYNIIAENEVGRLTFKYMDQFGLKIIQLQVKNKSAGKDWFRYFVRKHIMEIFRYKVQYYAFVHFAKKQKYTIILVDEMNKMIVVISKIPYILV